MRGEHKGRSNTLNNLTPPESRTGIPGRLADEDKVRIKLRESRRRIAPTSDPPTELVTLPGVSGLAFATRYIDGGRDRFIEYVQLAVLEHLPNATIWFAVYADLTTYERSIVSFDDVCAAAGVKPSKLMAEIITCAMDLGRDTGNFIAAMMHPKVIAKMTESAERIEGAYTDVALKDRHAFLQGMGVLPVPRAMQINVNASANAKAAAAASSDPSVPSFTQTLQAAADARRLPAASSDDLPFRVNAAEAVLIDANSDPSEES